MEALSTKYRPRTFDDVICQDNVKIVLENQLNEGEIKQAYLFTGSAGTGKTTCARIFANEVNDRKGKPIEIDGASNNGVDNIRTIIDDCRMKAIDCKYKVYIIDECHMLSTGAWNAFLKVLEEPPKGVIFILCTTDPQKIPATILSRLQRFDFKRIPHDEVVSRLKYIIGCENNNNVDVINPLDNNNLIEYDINALSYIAKLADGGMRDAIMKLDTVLGYTSEITLGAVMSCLGITDYQDMMSIVSSIVKLDAKTPIMIIDRLHKQGKDLKLFVKDLGKFVLDLCKYSLTQSFEYTMLPQDMQRDATKFVGACGIDVLVDILEGVNKIQDKIRYEQNPKTLIESELVLLCLM